MKINRILNKQSNQYEWQARFQLNGVEFKPKASTRKKLIELVDEIRALEQRSKHGLEIDKPKVLFKDVVKAKAEVLDLSNKRHRRWKKVLENFSDYLGEDFTINELSTSEIEKYIQKRKKESKLKPWSIHAELQMISSVLNSASILVKELSEYRAPRIPWIKVPSKGAGRVINAMERIHLLQALRAPKQKLKYTTKYGKPDVRFEHDRDVHTRHELADMFEIALNTAMRWGEEILPLQWSQISWDEAEIRLPKEITKSGIDEIVHLGPRVIEILKSRRNKTKWVFPNPKGTNHRKYYSAPLRKVAKRIGLHYGQELINGFTAHSTRHTAVTLMLQKTDIETVREIARHSKSRMTMLYSHTNNQSKKSAVANLENDLISESVGQKSD